MDTEPNPLDGEELLQLAVHAAARDRHDLAIRYLKEAVRRNADDAMAVYFLGVEHAQIGLYARAMQEMQRAIVIAPGLHTARLQLGMLQLTSGLAQEAAVTLRPLAELGDDNYFSCFGRGLLHLMRDEFAACRRWLEGGIAINTDSLALNGDMRSVLDALPAEGNPLPADPDSAHAAAANAAPQAGGFWLSAYAAAPDKGGTGKTN